MYAVNISQSGSNYDSTPHKRLRFEVRFQREPQDVRVLKAPKSLSHQRQHARRKEFDKQRFITEDGGRRIRDMKKESREGQGRDPSTFEINSSRRDPSTRQSNR